MPKCILSGQVKSTFTQEQADGRYIQMTNGATTTLASSLQVSGINNIEFTEEGEDPITASNVSYSNTTSGMTSGNVQNAIDELFQSVSEGKSLIAAAVTDKGVETAATDSFATMAGNIGQISSGGGGDIKDFVIENGTLYNFPSSEEILTLELFCDTSYYDYIRWIVYIEYVKTIPGEENGYSLIYDSPGQLDFSTASGNTLQIDSGSQLYMYNNADFEAMRVYVWCNHEYTEVQTPS